MRQLGLQSKLARNLNDKKMFAFKRSSIINAFITQMLYILISKIIPSFIPRATVLSEDENFPRHS